MNITQNKPINAVAEYLFLRIPRPTLYNFRKKGELIKNFALALIFGVIVGTYSSIYIASNALIMMGLSKDHLKEEEPENNALLTSPSNDKFNDLIWNY